MFNIGGGEFLVIALIALIVLGPQRLPEAARQVGKAMGELRRISSGFQNELKGAMNEAQRATTLPPARDVLNAATDVEPGPAPAARPPRREPLKAAPARKTTAKAARPPNKGS